MAGDLQHIGAGRLLGREAILTPHMARSRIRACLKGHAIGSTARVQVVPDIAQVRRKMPCKSHNRRVSGVCFAACHRPLSEPVERACLA